MTDGAGDTGVVLAIIGSVRFANPNAYSVALRECYAAISMLSPCLIVSGEADGMDTFAKTCADLLGVTYKGFPPANPRWEPDGYKDRNMAIAEAATHVLAIRCGAAKTYGSGWTADHAESLGRVVKRVIVDAS